MATLFLVIAALAVWVLGYRFYAKLLGLTVFRADLEYSPSPPPDGGRPVAANRHVVLGHHLAAIASAQTLFGVLAALTWGWGPAFLWVVAGTAVGAGTYGLGSLWLSWRHRGRSAAEIAASLMGSRAFGLYAALIFVLLSLFNAVQAAAAAWMLGATPSAVLPFWAVLLIAAALGAFLRARPAALAAASLTALGLALAAVWLLGRGALAFSGAINLDIGGTTAVSLGAPGVWALALFAYAYQAAQRPVDALMRPRGYLTALLLLAFLLIGYGGIAREMPALTIPQLAVSAVAPPVLPWLLVTVTGGALAGFHLLIANGITARALRNESDARYVGYGGAVGVGLLALGAILIGGLSLAAAPPWSGHVGSGMAAHDPRRLLELYLRGFTAVAARLGLDAALARTLAATTCASLFAVALEAGLRVQKQLLARTREHYGARALRSEHAPLRLATAVSGGLALVQLAPGGPTLWPALGLADEVFAVGGFLLLWLALRQARRPAPAVLAPLAVIGAATAWALARELWGGWRGDAWQFGFAVALALIEIAVLALGLRAVKTPAPRPPA